MFIHKVKKTSGFTLVELLVVVIILAVLASIVVPQFASSTDDAKVAALDSTLSNLRNSIELYYHQHGATYPGKNTSGANGSAASAQAMIDQLTLFTNSSGDAVQTKSATHKYGPYIKAQTFPKNPIDNTRTITINTTNQGALNATISANPTGGWWYDPESGKIMSNESEFSSH